jgi:hypothetical protein
MNDLVLALELRKKAYDGLEKLQGKDFSPRDVLEYLRVGVDLERTARFSSLAGREQENLLQVIGDMWTASGPEDAREMLQAFWDAAGELSAEYRQRFDLDRPAQKVLDLGRHIFEMQEDGLCRDEICKYYNLKIWQYYYLLAEYKGEARKNAER